MGHFTVEDDRERVLHVIQEPWSPGVSTLKTSINGADMCVFWTLDGLGYLKLRGFELNSTCWPMSLGGLMKSSRAGEQGSTRRDGENIHDAWLIVIAS